MKKSDIVSKIHVTLCVYLIGGWMLPLLNSKILIGFIPCVYANWLVDKHKCILTRLEHHFLEEESKKEDTKIDIKYEGFVSKILKKYDINLKDEDINKLLVIVTFHSFFQSYRNVVLQI